MTNQALTPPPTTRSLPEAARSGGSAGRSPFGSALLLMLLLLWQCWWYCCCSIVMGWLQTVWKVRLGRDCRVIMSVPAGLYLQGVGRGLRSCLGLCKGRKERWTREA